MQNPLLLVDTWESGGELDEDILKQSGVSGAIIRLNDMNGGHHKDANFDNQWLQAKNLIRIPYFVYNPWVSGSKNYDWLAANMPKEAGSVMIDVEVVYSGYPAANYASELKIFMDYVKTKWNTMIYTGQWFLNNLSYWPKDVKYWWAQYPYAFYPSGTQSWSWDDIRTKLEGYTSPSNSESCPGPIGMWQFTGDRLILPGCTKPTDVNVFFGTETELALFAYGLSTDVVTRPYEGVIVHRLTRFGCPVTVHVIDPLSVKVWVSGREDDFQQVTQTVAKHGAHGGTNGGGWPYGSTYANEIWKSNGVLIQSTAKDDRPWIGITEDNAIAFGRGIPAPFVRDVVGYDRYLIENGVPNEKYRYNYPTKDARTFSGSTWDGKLILCVAEGDDRKNYGLTFWEETLVLQEFGAVTGGNHDGGSSSTCIDLALSPDSLNMPSDGVQAYVINAILFKAEVPPPPPPQGEPMDYVVTASVTPRMTPSMYETVTAPSLAVGYTFTSTVEYVKTETIKGVTYDITFVQLPNGYWVPVYLPYTGVTYAKPVVPEPAPTNWPAYFILEDPNGNRQRYNIETNPA